MIAIVITRISKNPRGIIWSDCEGYYMYLPAVFIQKDVHKMEHGSVRETLNDKGEFVDKFTCGVAMLQAPAFLITKMYAQIKGLDRMDYFGQHYSYGIGIGGFLIGMLGLFFLKKALTKDFSDTVVIFTLLSTFLGTNLFHYATKEMGMSHVYSFMLFALLVWRVPLFYKKSSLWAASLIGLTMGLIVLIRPTNIIIALFFVFYDVYNLEQLKTRILWYLKNTKYIFITIISAFLIFIPQLMYWYEMTGNYIYYSYQKEGFPYWNRPKFAAVLFDSQNGLFTYSPMVLLMVAGIPISGKQKKHQYIIIGLLFILAAYIFSSWWAWWFGGAFGHRCFVEYYAILSIPLAVLIQKALKSHSPLWKSIFLILLVFLMFYSVKMSFMYASPWDGADWRWNLDKMIGLWKRLFIF